jgi:hypothetical protein
LDRAFPWLRVPPHLFPRVIRRAGAPCRSLGSAWVRFGLGLAVEGQEGLVQAGLLDRDVGHRWLQQSPQRRHQRSGRDQQAQLVPGPGRRPTPIHRHRAVVMALGEAEPDPPGPRLAQGRHRLHPLAQLLASWGRRALQLTEQRQVLAAGQFPISGSVHAMIFPSSRCDPARWWGGGRMPEGPRWRCPKALVLGMACAVAAVAVRWQG